MKTRRTPDIPYEFANADLLREALTHRSAASRNNERLEFLGDGVVNFVVAGVLYRNFPDSGEGRLSRLRARLVRRETLAELARDLKLGDFLLLGPGEMKSGGHRRESILADAFEAVVGAIYLDGGFDAAESFLLTLYGERLEEEPQPGELKDPKTTLQEYLQARQIPLPDYVLTRTSGKEHQREFLVECRVDSLSLVAEGQGSTRRKAEQVAADELFQQLLAKDATPDG